MQASPRVVPTNVAMGPADEDLAIDAARAFLGPNASYFDETWRVMGWRGRQTSWNLWAALGGPLWLAYRRMPVFALAFALWIELVLVLLQRGWSSLPLAFLMMLAMAISGLFGNALYLRRFRRVLGVVELASIPVLERERALMREGGVSPGSAWLAAGGIVTQVILTPLLA